MEPVIKIESLSKIYRLGQIGTGTIRDDFKRWTYKLKGKEDPFLKVGETNKRTSKGSSEYVWAIKDINLEVMPGEVLGIIGKNGAGKSTLLKILSKVTGPTTGSISYNGRIGSLLEVGTGFHQELTGRENIFLNGAILGMTKDEIKKKLDEIIDFSGCERYIDTPVKRYSSGMMVRLGFAVAAHLEPEILVVDEVLAVGDAEFQKKAIGKMQDVSKNDGRTIIFVSHNMGSILSLCNRGVFLKNGTVDFMGDIGAVVNKYIMTSTISGGFYSNMQCDLDIFIKNLHLTNCKEVKTNSFQLDDNIILNFSIQINKWIPNSVISFIISDKRQIHILTSHFDLSENGNNVLASLPKRFLLPGIYYMKFFIHLPNLKFIDTCNESILQFEIEDTGNEHSIYKGVDLGLVSVNVNWKNNNSS